MSRYKLSRDGLEVIKKHEGLMLRAYIPVRGDVWTIGYGHTTGVKSGDVITAEEAESFLFEDVQWAEAVLNKHVTVKLEQNQADALISFIFNVGEGQFSKSTLLRELNKGNYHNVPHQLKRWVFSGGVRYDGLVRRRNDEGELFSADYVDPFGPMPRSVDPVDKKISIVQTIKESRKAKSAAGMMGGGALQATSSVMEKLGEAKGQAEGFISHFQDLVSDPYILIAAIIVIGCGYMIYLQRDDKTKKRAY